MRDLDLRARGEARASRPRAGAPGACARRARRPFAAHDLRVPPCCIEQLPAFSCRRLRLCSWPVSTPEPSGARPAVDWRDRAEHGLVRARPLWVVLLLALLVPLGVRGVEDARRPAPRGDTRFYVRAAGNFLAGRPLYHDAYGRTTSYTYPPPFAAVCAWTVPLPYALVRVLWLVIMTGCAVGAAALALRWLREADPPATARPHLLLALALAPTLRFGVNDLAHGQTNWLIALLVAATLLLLQRRRDLGAGACLGAALVIKPTAWPLLAWLAVTRRPRALGGVLLAALVAMLPVALRYGPAGAVGEALAWLGAMPGFAELEALSADNASLASTLHRLLSGVKVHPDEGGGHAPLLLAIDLAAARPWARAAAVLLVSIGFGWLAWRRRREPPALAALLPLAALLSPVTWKAHLVALLPATLVLARRLAEGPGDRRTWGVWAALVAWFTLPSRGLLDLSWAAAWGSTTAGLALLFCWLAAEARRDPGEVVALARPEGYDCDAEAS